MEHLTEWIVNIITFLLLAMIIDLLLPESNIRKYTKLVIGLLLITIIITPLFKLMSTDFEKILFSITNNFETNEQSMGFLLEKKKKEIQASQQAYTLEQMAVQMKKSVEKELMDKYQVEIEEIKIIAKLDESVALTDNMEKVTVYITPATNSNTAVQPVHINVGENKDKGDNNPETQEIRNTLSSQWEISESLIEIVSREDVK